MTQPINPVAESVKAALAGARAMVENTPILTAWDLRSQVNILSAVLVAVRKELGDPAAAAAGELVDLLIEKGRAARLDVREAEALRRVLPDVAASGAVTNVTTSPRLLTDEELAAAEPNAPMFYGKAPRPLTPEELRRCKVEGCGKTVRDIIVRNVLGRPQVRPWPLCAFHGDRPADLVETTDGRLHYRPGPA